MRSRYGADKRPGLLCAGGVLYAVCVFLYGPMCAIYLLSFQGPHGASPSPCGASRCNWFAALFAQHRTGDFAGAFLRSILLAVLVLGITVVLSVMAGLAFRRRFCRCHPGVLSGHCQPDHAGVAGGAGHWLDVPTDWATTGLVHVRAGGATDLDAALWAAYHVCGAQPF